MKKSIFHMLPVILLLIALLNANFITAQLPDMSKFYLSALIKKESNEQLVITFDSGNATLYSINGKQTLPYTITPQVKTQFLLNINEGDYLFYMDPKNFSNIISQVKQPEGIFGRNIYLGTLIVGLIPETNQLTNKIWVGARQNIYGKDQVKKCYYVFKNSSYYWGTNVARFNTTEGGFAYEPIANMGFYCKTNFYTEIGFIGLQGFNCTFKDKAGTMQFTYLEVE